MAIGSTMLYIGPEPDQADNDTLAESGFAGNVGFFPGPGVPVGLIQSDSFSGDVQSIDDTGFGNGPDIADFVHFSIGGLTRAVGLGIKIDQFGTWQQEVVGTGFGGASYVVTVQYGGLVSESETLIVSFGSMKLEYSANSFDWVAKTNTLLNAAYAAGFASDAWNAWVPLWNDIADIFNEWTALLEFGHVDFLGEYQRLQDALDVKHAEVKSYKNSPLRSQEPEFYKALKDYSLATIKLLDTFPDPEITLNGVIVDPFTHPELTLGIGLELFKEFDVDTGDEPQADITAQVTGQNQKVLVDGGLVAGSLEYGLGIQTIAYQNPGITGSPGNDVISGTAFSETIKGLQGDDVINGRGGDDQIYGGTGDDRLSGGPGDDRIFGGPGRDKLYGNNGDDRLSGGLGNDKLFGGGGQDILSGGSGNDKLSGQGDADTLKGEDGDDKLNGGQGSDKLYGGRNNDFLTGKAGNDRLWGDHGRDTLNGGLGNDRLTGGTHADEFRFVSAGAEFGRDVITDFQIGVDTLHLISASGEAGTFGEFVAASSQSGSDVVYDSGGDSKNVITLQNILLTSLSASDFDFS